MQRKVINNSKKTGKEGRRPFSISLISHPTFRSFFTLSHFCESSVMKPTPVTM